jgi:hypothetical protein
LLLALNVLAWPIFYLLLQSYVAEWPGVMCIYGVTRVGTGSIGAARFLPTLLTVLQITKPLVVFLGGSWLALHLVNRETRTGPLSGRVVLILSACGLLAAGDAAAEIAYLGIPKKEEFVSAGCCLADFEGASASRFYPGGLFTEGGRGWLYVAYFGVNAGLIAALGGAVRASRTHTPAGWLVPLFVGGLLAVAVNAVFLSEIAAPRLLRMPGHHCVYDLIPRAPEALPAAVFGLLGCFFVGWGCVVGWLGRSPEAVALVPGMVGTLFRFAAVGLGLSALLLSLELAALG